MGSNPVVTVFVIVAAIALVIQAGVMVGIAIGLAAAQKRVVKVLEEAHGRIAPVLITTKAVLDDAAPKIKRITSNIEEITETAKHETSHLSTVMDDLLRRSQEHIQHADAILAHTLETVEEARSSVTHVVMQPVKWATAMANGISTGVQHLLERRRVGSSTIAATEANRPWEPGQNAGPRKVYRPWEPDPADLKN